MKSAPLLAFGVFFVTLGPVEVLRSGQPLEMREAFLSKSLLSDTQLLDKSQTPIDQLSFQQAQQLTFQQPPLLKFDVIPFFFDTMLGAFSL